MRTLVPQKTFWVFLTFVSEGSCLFLRHSYTVTLLWNVSGKMHPTHVNCIFFETDVLELLWVDVLHYRIFCRRLVLCLKMFIQLHCFHTSTRAKFHDTFMICQPFFRHFPGTKIIFCLNILTDLPGLSRSITPSRKNIQGIILIEFWYLKLILFIWFLFSLYFVHSNKIFGEDRYFVKL